MVGGSNPPTRTIFNKRLMITEEDIGMARYKLVRLVATKNRMKRVDLPESEQRVRMADTCFKALLRKQYSSLTKKKNLLRLIECLGELTSARLARDKKVKVFRDLKSKIKEYRDNLNAMEVRKRLEEIM